MVLITNYKYQQSEFICYSYKNLLIIHFCFLLSISPSLYLCIVLSVSPLPFLQCNLYLLVRLHSSSIYLNLFLNSAFLIGAGLKIVFAFGAGLPAPFCPLTSMYVTLLPPDSARPVPTTTIILSICQQDSIKPHSKDNYTTYTPHTTLLFDITLIPVVRVAVGAWRDKSSKSSGRSSSFPSLSSAAKTLLNKSICSFFVL